VDTAEPHESAVEAARRMRDRQVGTLIVVDAASKPIGVLTDRDLVTRGLARGGDGDGQTIGDLMSPLPATVLETTPIEAALSHMRVGRLRRLPVVDQHGGLVGILTLDDILMLLAEEFSLIGRVLAREAPHQRTAAR
jgi:CBS domain-containing protein